MSQRPQTFALAGGLDLVSPPAQFPPGALMGCLNYEGESRGYARIEGYERFDGRPKPSEATYLWVEFDTGTAAITAGTAVAGLTSGATATALIDAVVQAGSYGTSDAQGYIVLHASTGTFLDGEQLQVGGVTRMHLSATPVADGAPTDELNATWREAVTALRRAAIAAPPGSGPVRGVATYQGAVWCWRDNVGATAGVMYKSTAAGWVAQSFGHVLKFTAGNTAEIPEGTTITGLTSGATGVVRRVAKQTGGYSTSDAAGQLTLSGVTGVWVNGEAIRVAGVTRATTDGGATAITLPAGATVKAEVGNFYATSGYERLYFITTVGRAYEWDGTVLSPIYTGMSDATDKPLHLAIHQLHLFLAFAGGSLQFSSLGLPLIWSAITGAGEVGFGQDITGLKAETSGALIVAGRNKLGYMTGSSLADFQLKPISEESGAIAGTLEVAGSPIYLDDQGLRDLQATPAYGDWKQGSLSLKVAPYLDARRAAGLSPLGVLRVKAKDHYRLVWPDGAILSVYLGRKAPEFFLSQLGFTPSCLWSGEIDGFEVLFAGGDDGLVYQIDVGTSFDGAALEAYCRTGFINQGDPLVYKHYHRAMLSGIGGTRHSALSVGADFDYGGGEIPAAVQADFTVHGSGGFWEAAFWDQFFWDSGVAEEAWFDLNAKAANVSFVISSSSATETPHVLSTLTVNYTLRGRKR